MTSLPVSKPWSTRLGAVTRERPLAEWRWSDDFHEDNEVIDFMDYHDEGCPDYPDVPGSQPSCLSCPLPVCRFETHDLDYYVKLERKLERTGR